MHGCKRCGKPLHAISQLNDEPKEMERPFTFIPPVHWPFNPSRMNKLIAAALFVLLAPVTLAQKISPTKLSGTATPSVVTG
jgi:hypothetical protein